MEVPDDVWYGVELLLENIRDWMIENDYECGERGSELYDAICELVGEGE